MTARFGREKLQALVVQTGNLNPTERAALQRRFGTRLQAVGQVVARVSPRCQAELIGSRLEPLDLAPR